MAAPPSITENSALFLAQRAARAANVAGAPRPHSHSRIRGPSGRMSFLLRALFGPKKTATRRPILGLMPIGRLESVRHASDKAR